MTDSHRFYGAFGGGSLEVEILECVRGLALEWPRFPAYDAAGRGVGELLNEIETVGREARWTRELVGNTSDVEPLYAYSSGQGGYPTRGRPASSPPRLPPPRSRGEPGGRSGGCESTTRTSSC